MKAYISQSIKKKDEAVRLKRILTKAGIDVTSTWIDIDTGLQDPLDNPSLSREFAVTDLEDIHKSDVFIFFSEGLSPGKYTEFGYALALNIPIYIIGPVTSVFHHLPNVMQVFEGGDSFVAFISTYRNALSPVLRLARKRH